MSSSTSHAPLVPPLSACLLVFLLLSTFPIAFIGSLDSRSKCEPVALFDAIRLEPMGVHGLWQLVEKGSENHALRTLTVREGFEAKRDRFIWMKQLEHKFNVGHAQSGENPELRTFLFRLSALADYPVHLVFVADGPLRPNVKRGVQVKTAPPWLTDGMRNLAEAFGFGWIQAAGEAEAELAEMNARGLIDAVMTDDGDALLFGARVVLRNCELKRSEKHSVDVYRAEGIAAKAKLSRPDLVLYALLVGCDYDMTGLDKCGDQTARGLIRYGAGQALFDMVANHKDDDSRLRMGMEDWRSQLRIMLRTDPKGFIGRTNRALADKVPSSFPHIDVLHCFVSPALLPVSSYSSALNPSPIDFARLGALCELHFGWGNRPQLLQKCRKLFWSNEVVRMLVVEGLRREERVEPAPASRCLVGVAVEAVDEPPAFGYALCHIRIFDDGVGDAITSALRGLREYHGTKKAPEEQVLLEAGRSIMFRIPAVIVERARPLKVNPLFTTEGYLYGRVHLNPAMRNYGELRSCRRSRSASPGRSRATSTSKITAGPSAPRASSDVRVMPGSNVGSVTHPQPARAVFRSSNSEIIDLTLSDSE